MSHPFGDLIRQHLNRKHGLSQNKLAAGIDQDASVISKMCRGKRLSGKQARQRVICIIEWFYAEGVLTLVAEATALLEAAGMARLNAEETIEAELLEQLTNETKTEKIGLGQSLFLRRDEALSRETDETILLKLNDWKIVHSNAQELLLAILNIEYDLRVLLYHRTRNKAVDVESAWYQYCESQALNIRRNIRALKIRHSLVSQLGVMLQGEQYFISCLERFIDTDDRGRLRDIQTSYHKLKDTLIELLRVAGDRISAIIEELIMRYNEKLSSSEKEEGGEDE